MGSFIDLLTAPRGEQKESRPLQPLSDGGGGDVDETGTHLSSFGVP